MKKTWAVIAVLLGCMLVLASVDLTAQPQPNRLVADNRTSGYVDLYSWSWNGSAWAWTFVVRINPTSWVGLPGVQNGQVFRAVLGPNNYRDHTVNLQWDAGYNGFQDVWWVN